MTTLPRPLPAGNAGPEMVRALIGGHCDGDPAASDGFDLPPLEAADYDPSATFDLAVTPDLLVPFDLSVTETNPPAAVVAPFPEPPADLPYYSADALKVDIFRTAWPHLSADQRAEVSRLVGCVVRSAERTAADRAKAAQGPPRPTPLERDWHELSASVALAARHVAAHAAGWVAAADRQADPDDLHWPHQVPAALEATAWVLASVSGTLNGEVCGWWGDAPHHHVFPLVPLLDADPDALPAGWDDRRDRLADLVALLDDVGDDLGRCLDQQERLPGFDPVNGSLLDALGGGRLALDATLSGLRTDLDPEMTAASARRALDRLRTAKRLRHSADREAA